jgi:hypothetical protein
MARTVKKREKGNKLPWSSWTVLSSFRYYLYGGKNYDAKKKIYTIIHLSDYEEFIEGNKPV